MSPALFQVGDRVRKNPAAWEPDCFDQFGRGRGVGTVVEPPFPVDDLGMVDVRWAPGCRYFEKAAGLLPAEAPGG